MNVLVAMLYAGPRWVAQEGGRVAAERESSWVEETWDL